MTVGLGEEAGFSQDPRYRRGMVHLQSGAWDEAIACFEELAQAYPDSQAAQDALEEAQFKARLAGQRRIRPKRWIIPWRPILVRGLILLATVFLAIQGIRLVQGQVAPALAELQERQRLAALEQEGNDLFEGGAWDEAETRYHELLTAMPEHPAIIERLAQIDFEREVAALYKEGVSLEEAGQDDEALATYMQVILLSPHYLDVTLRIEGITRRQDHDALFARAEAAYEAGRDLEAMTLYKQIRSQAANYRPEIIAQRLYELYMQQGRGLIGQDPPAPEAIPQALEYFELALQLQPRSAEAAQEKKLITLYLDGQALFEAGQWAGAIAPLRTVFDLRPGYLRGTVAGMLYEAYLRSGDGYRDAEEPDCGLAYQRYGQAAGLPVADTAVAEARQQAVAYCVPPTSTPTVTPTPTNTPVPPTATAWPTWTSIPPTAAPTPTPTPWNLAGLRNQIIFKSATRMKRSCWVMDSKGENRRYLGLFEAYSGQYYAIHEAERFSPDGIHRVFVKEGILGTLRSLCTSRRTRSMAICLTSSSAFWMA